MFYTEKHRSSPEKKLAKEIIEIITAREEIGPKTTSLQTQTILLSLTNRALVDFCNKLTHYKAFPDILTGKNKERSQESKTKKDATVATFLVHMPPWKRIT